MNTKKLKEYILESLNKEFADAETASMLVKKEENDELPYDILTALLTDMGADGDELCLEAGFMDTSLGDGDETFLLYGCNVVFSEEIDDYFAPLVREAIGRLNYYIPNGAFGCDDGTLMYKSSSMLPANIDKESCLDVCRGMIVAAMSVANLYARPLLRLSEGNMTLPEVYEGLLESWDMEE